MSSSGAAAAGGRAAPSHRGPRPRHAAADRRPLEREPGDVPGSVPRWLARRSVLVAEQRRAHRHHAQDESRHQRGSTGHHSPVPADPPRLPHQQGGKASDLHPHGQGRPDRGQSDGAHPADVQALRRSHGAAAAPALHTVDRLAGEAAQGDQESRHRPPSDPLSQGDPELRLARGAGPGLHRRRRQQGERLRLRRSHGQGSRHLCRPVRRRQDQHQQLQLERERCLQPLLPRRRGRLGYRLARAVLCAAKEPEPRSAVLPSRLRIFRPRPNLERGIMWGATIATSACLTW